MGYYRFFQRSYIICVESINGRIRTNPRPQCCICGAQGEPLYKELEDHLFGSPGSWNFVKCPNRECGLIWMNPQPVPEDLRRIYSDYYTHDPPKFRPIIESLMYNIFTRCYGYAYYDQASFNVLGKILSYLPLMKDIVGMEIMRIPSSWEGKILDVGCGNGRFLRHMQKLGRHVQGIDPDANSAALVKEWFDINVSVGTLEESGLPASSFDLVTMSHVIEHVYNPIQSLKECLRVLKLGGKLVLTTPNIESLGHKRLKKYWRGLEPPRHLMLFSQRSLQMCALRAGFVTETLCSATAGARGFYWASKLLQKGSHSIGIPKRLKKTLKARGYLFQLCEEIARHAYDNLGEEIYYIGVKTSDSK